MKNTFILLSVILLSLLNTSCSKDSASDEFNNANGKVKVKHIESILISSDQPSEVDRNTFFHYSEDGKLTSIKRGNKVNLLIYGENDELTKISGSDKLVIEDLYDSPIDAFKKGDVLDYDDDGNPIVIGYYDEAYNTTTHKWEDVLYTAEISYDNKPNPYFYTLQAGGIIDVLDNVNLNFSIIPQMPELVQARKLLPVHNPSKIIYKTDKGVVKYIVDFEYSYDSDNYPIYARVTATAVSNNDTSTYDTVFEYKK